MNATEKSPAIETMLNSFGVNRRASISNNKCIAPPIGCGGDANNFRDELSRKEYTIFGLCQKCQDKIFGV